MPHHVSRSTLGDVTGTVDGDDDVGVLDHAFEAVLGHDDGDAEVVDQACQGGEHFLGGGRIEGGGGLVEHEHARMGGEDGADGHALLLAAGQRTERSAAQGLEPEEIEGLLDAFAHDRGGHGELFHGVGELVFDGVGDEAVDRVLHDHADHVGEIAGPVVAGVVPVDGDAPGEGAAGEVGNQSVDGAQECRLARAGATDDEAELALDDVHVDVAQRRGGRVGIGDGDVVEADHATATSRTAASVPRAVVGGASQAGATAMSAASSGNQPIVGQRNGWTDG